MFNSIHDLECHFTWNPEMDSTKKDDPEKVIKKTEQKMSRRPYFKVVYLIILSYMHCRKINPDVAKADEYQTEADDLNNKVQAGNYGNLHMACEFIVVANRLHLKNMRNQLLEPEKQEKLQQLNELWATKSCEAQLLAVKGATFDCFGPNKYQVGADAFAKARKLLAEADEPKNFYWLAGEARLLGRIARLNSRDEPASAEQIQLWQEARDIGEREKLTDALFYAYYAEDILHNREMTDLCRELTQRSVAKLMALSNEEKNDLYPAYRINLKVHLRLKLDMKDVEQFISNALMVEKVKQDSDFHLKLANLIRNSNTGDETKKNKRQIRLLRKGKSLEPDHIWINLRLIELEASEAGKEETINKYDGLKLRRTISSYCSNVAVVEFHKALFLLQTGDIDLALNECVQAYRSDESLNKKINWKMRKQFLVLMSKHSSTKEEFVAWFIRISELFSKVIFEIFSNNSELNITKTVSEGKINYDSFSDSVVEQLLKKSLDKDPTNSFAWKELGRFYLDKNKFNEAVTCFSDIEDDQEARMLLARALYLSPDRTIETLTKCLKLGCRDAAGCLLDTMEAEGSQGEQKLYWFRSKAYELCARIENMVDSKEGYFHKGSDDVDEWSSEIKSRIRKLLRLRDEHCDKDKDMTVIRKGRLDACKLQLSGKDDEERDQKICTTLEGSKNSLDRTIKRVGNNDFYIFAFNALLNSTSRSQSKVLKIESSKSVIDNLKSAVNPDPELKNEKKMNDSLNGLKVRPDSQKADLVDFLLRRELRIIQSEGAWQVLFSDVANDIKHNAASKKAVLSSSDICRDLDAMLDKSDHGPRTAYELMHCAAEFAEETLVKMLDISSLSRGWSKTVCGIQLSEVDLDWLEDGELTDNVISASVLLGLQKTQNANQWRYVQPITIDWLNSIAHDSPDDQHLVFPPESNASLFLVPTMITPASESHRILLKVNVNDGVVEILDPNLQDLESLSHSVALKLCELARARFRKDFKTEERQCTKVTEQSKADSGLLVTLFCHELLQNKNPMHLEKRVKGGRDWIKKIVDRQ